jgi:hypothetical protein
MIFNPILVSHDSDVLFKIKNVKIFLYKKFYIPIKIPQLRRWKKIWVLKYFYFMKDGKQNLHNDKQKKCSF